MKLFRFFRRSLAISLTASTLLLAIVPDTAYASAPAPDVSLGTPASADMPEDFSDSGDFGMSKYEKSFEYCPETLETVLNPQSRVIPAIPAVIYVLTVILAACGIYISFKDDIIAIFTSFESWLRTNYGDNANVMKTWQDVLGANAGSALYSMSIFIPIFKKYLNTSIYGYGTAEPVYSVPSQNVDFSGLSASQLAIRNKYPAFAHNFKYFLFHAATSEYSYNYYLVLSNSPVRFVKSSGFDGTGSTRSGYETVNNSKVTYYCSDKISDLVVGGGYKVTNYSRFDMNDSSAYGGLASNVFGTLPIYDYDKTTLIYSSGVAFSPDKAWSDLQTKDDATNIEYGDTLTIPAAQEAMNQLLAALAAAESAKAAAEALAPSITVTDTKPAEGEDDEAQKLPWFPAISKWLTGIQAGVDSLGEQISTFPQTMADIKDSIISIPGAITDFFTLDMTVVSASFVSLQDAFKGRFGGIAQLGSIFQKSYALDMVIPVFTVKVPPELSQLFPGKTELVIMDLRPYKDQFLWGRSLLVAIFYVSFAKWLLDQFDVKLNVG